MCVCAKTFLGLVWCGVVWCGVCGVGRLVIPVGTGMLVVVESKDETEGVIDSLIIFFQVENEERDLWRDVGFGGDIIPKFGTMTSKDGGGSKDDIFFFLFFVTKEERSFNIIFLRKKVIMDSLLPISGGGDLHLFSRIRRHMFPCGPFILPFRYQSGM